MTTRNTNTIARKELTAPLTLEELEAYIDDPNLRDFLPVRIARQCLATMQREATATIDLALRNSAYDFLAQQLTESMQREAKLREALWFYASEENYDDNCAPVRYCFHEGIDHQETDLGKTAREILSTT